MKRLMGVVDSGCQAWKQTLGVVFSSPPWVGMPRACWGAEAAPVITERRQDRQDTTGRQDTAVQRHRAYLQDLQDRKAHERERVALANAEGTGAAMHEREVGFSVLFNGANQRTRAAALSTAHRGRLPLQAGCLSPSSPQHQCQLVEPPPTAKRRQLAAAGLGAPATTFAEGLPRRRRWSLKQPVVVLDTHTGDLLRVIPTRRLLPALGHHGSAGPVEGMPAPWPAAGARPLGALLEPPASPERPEEEEGEEEEQEEEEEEEEEETEEEATDARDAACECRCALGSDLDGSQPVEESPLASAVDAAAPTPPSRIEGDAMIRGDDHDTLRPLYPAVV